MLTVHDGGGGGSSAKAVQEGDGLINPDLIPCAGLEPEQIEAAASSFTTQGGLIRTNSQSVVTAWSGMAPNYVAPESATVLSLMDPVASESDILAGKMETVGSALQTFAEAVVPIKAELERIKTDAAEFVASVRNGVYVQPSDPDHPQFTEWANRQSYTYSASTATSYQGNWGGGSGSTASEPAPIYGTTIYWKEHGPSVQRNNELVALVADQYALLDAAQVEAGNKILALVENSCVAPLEAVEAWQLKQEGVELPWGTTVDKQRDCGESFVHGMGEAVVSFGEGIGSLFGYNPLTGEWGDGEWAGEAWKGLGMTVAGLALAGPVSIGIMLAPPGAVPAPVRDFVVGSQEALVGAVKGIVAWDTWSENPAEAAGTTLVNVGTFFIPAAGQVGGVLKATSAGARVASVATWAGRAADVAVPGGSFVVRGFSEGVLGNALRFGRGVDDAISFDLRLHGNPAGLGQLPDGGFPHGDGAHPFGGQHPFDLPSNAFDGRPDLNVGPHGHGGGIDVNGGFDGGPGAGHAADGGAGHGSDGGAATTGPDGTGTTGPDGTAGHGSDSGSGTGHGTDSGAGSDGTGNTPTPPPPAHLNATHPDGSPMSFSEWNTAHGDPNAPLNTNKGHFGEIRAEEYMHSQGWERIDDGADGTKNPNAPGVDGIYRYTDAEGDTHYVVTEAKYGSSTLGNTLDGRQMSDSWLNGDVTGTDRLDQAMRQADGDTYDSFFDAHARGDVDKVLLHVSPDGTVDAHALDADGRKVGSPGAGAGAAPHVPSHTSLLEPPTHAGADAPQVPRLEFDRIDQEFRLADGAVDPNRMAEWADRVSDAYPALTPDQARAIYAYTTDAGYTSMNQYLRDAAVSHPTVGELEAQITHVTQGLANLPAEPTVTQPYFRGMSFPSDLLDQFIPGQRWSDPAFLSASNSPAVADSFLIANSSSSTPVGTVTIIGRTPSDVSPLSRFPSESEFLFQRGTQFDVIGKFQDQFGFWRISLREVE